MKRRGRTPKLDDIDIKIIDMLHQNGRKSLVSIAEEVGLTHPSVKERLKRLTESEIIKVQANINLQKLNLFTSLINADVSDPTELKELIEYLKHCPRVLSIMYATGEYNVVILAAASDERSMRAFIDNNLRGLKSLKKISIVNVDIVFPKFLPFRIVPPEECLEKCNNCVFKTKLGICDGCAGIIDIMKAIKLKEV